MDFFDVAILILVFGLVFKKLISQKVYVVSLILSALVVVVQILMVGYKWQYVPLYLIIVISAINYKIGFRFNNRILKSLSLSFLFLLFFVYDLSLYLASFHYLIRSFPNPFYLYLKYYPSITLTYLQAAN